AGVVEEGELLLEEVLDLALIEPEADHALDRLLHDARAALHPVLGRRPRLLGDGVPAALPRLEQPFGFEQLVRLADGVERDAELVAEAARGGEPLARPEPPRREVEPELLDELLDDGRARVAVELDHGRGSVEITARHEVVAARAAVLAADVLQALAAVRAVVPVAQSGLGRALRRGCSRAVRRLEEVVLPSRRVHLTGWRGPHARTAMPRRSRTRRPRALRSAASPAVRSCGASGRWARPRPAASGAAYRPGGAGAASARPPRPTPSGGRRAARRGRARPASAGGR